MNFMDGFNLCVVTGIACGLAWGDYFINFESLVFYIDHVRVPTHIIVGSAYAGYVLEPYLPSFRG